MHSTRDLKIWTIITHFFIPFGIGHGIAFFGLFEIVLFPYIIHPGFSLSLNVPFENCLPAAGLCSFTGHAALIASILLADKKKKLLLHIAGLLLLWMSIYYLVHDINHNMSGGFSLLFCIPFFICTLLPFITVPAKRLFNWMLS